ncbi:hypothetical protein YC2023_082822 [Brassica napus]
MHFDTSQSLDILLFQLVFSKSLSSCPNVLRSHVLEVSSGADIVESVNTYGQRGRGVSVLSGNGTVANVVLRQPVTIHGNNCGTGAGVGGVVTLHGKFDIIPSLVRCFRRDQVYTLAGMVIPPNSRGITIGDLGSIVRTVKETMEKAFWDSVMESMKLEEPDYSCISNLMREVRDELCQMVPDSWKVEITETIDLDLLSQLLNSGTLDIDYLGKMLEFALATLRKLSAPANDRENESTHHSLLEELHWLCQAKDESGSLHAVAIVKGIRFILEKIHVSRDRHWAHFIGVLLVMLKREFAVSVFNLNILLEGLWKNLEYGKNVTLLPNRVSVAIVLGEHQAHINITDSKKSSAIFVSEAAKK